jgi:hypothetical protein
VDDYRNYGVQYDHPTAEELDRRWMRIVAFGVVRGIVITAVVLLVACLMVWGLYDAITGDAVCEGMTCSEALR